MVGLRWTQDEVDAVGPERRERLLWALYAERVTAVRDRVAERVVWDANGANAKQAALTSLDLLLYPIDPVKRAH